VENKAMEPTFWVKDNQANSRRENVLQRDVLKLKQQLDYQQWKSTFSNRKYIFIHGGFSSQLC